MKFGYQFFIWLYKNYQFQCFKKKLWSTAFLIGFFVMFFFFVEYWISWITFTKNDVQQVHMLW